jgi:hypothetical protein
MIDEEVLSSALHELAEREETGTAPVERLVRQGHRARLGRAARTVALAAAAIGLAAGGTVVVAGAGEPAPVPLALAAQTTARTTFHFRMETRLEWISGYVLPEAPVQGGDDPVHDRRYWTQEFPTGWRPEWRQIGPDCFFRDAWGVWGRTSPCPGFTRPDPETAMLGVSASPGELLAQLRQAGQVSYAGRTGKGRQAIDSYRFTYQISAGEAVMTRTGTVDIDVANRRIVKVSYRDQYVLKRDHRPAQMREDVVLRLYDFGVPVDVPIPVLPSPGPSRSGP